MENVRVLPQERSSATVEVELLGEPGEKLDGYGRRFSCWVGEDEVLYGDDLEEVLVFVHELLENRVS